MVSENVPVTICLLCDATWNCAVVKRLADANWAKDIQELCDEYYIETRHIEKLNELMKDRP